VQGDTVHQICLPIHFGYAGEITGSSENELLPIVSDPNVSMHEGKAFACQVMKGRLEHPSDVPTAPVHPRPRPEPMPATAAEAQPEGRTA
jgi:formate dehydrogenase major subunit